MNDKRTALYRHFSKDGTLLYCGISLSPISRLCQHRDDSGWFHEISRVEIEWFPDRKSALIAEKTAIQGERPKHNIVHAVPGEAGSTDEERAWPIPASRALIAWMFSDASGQSVPAVAVGHLLDEHMPDWTRDYEYSGGAAWVRRRGMSEIEQRFHVMRDYYELVHSYGIDAHLVYRAFLNIKEFQDIIKEAGMGPDKGEPGHDKSVGYGRSIEYPETPTHVLRYWHSEHVFPVTVVALAA